MEPPAPSPITPGRDTEAFSPLPAAPDPAATVETSSTEEPVWAAAPVPANVPAPSANDIGWHMVGALVYALATVLILAVGPVALTALGPSWLGWLVWPLVLFTGWRMLRHFQGLAEVRVELAAGMALLIGAMLGMGWGMAAETGWLPPLTMPNLGAAPSAPPTVTPTGAQFHIGVTVRVTQTQGAGLRVRSGAGVNTEPVGFLAEGAEARIIAGPQYADSFRWWQVEGAGVTGWVADPWLEVE